ncbi:MAG: class I SAM-dependent methyltransferase [Nitrospirota bacterium]|nr:class I SAM-dependent methyltransferase [Nitrospirota bacterium]
MEQPKHNVDEHLLMADLADPHALYQQSVQSPDNDIPFLAAHYKDTTGHPLRNFREDFCGTAGLSTYFVSEHPDNQAMGVDLDWPTLNWGIKHNVSCLTPDQQQRLTLVHGNVLESHPSQAQLTVAMNFSYMVFKDRPTLLHYFTRAKESLQPGGMFVLDIWGGSESQVLQEESREIDNPEDDGIGDFTFVWDQDIFDPVTHFCTTRIHFAFQDGSELRNAFVYDWRLWTIPEVMELLQEAGFQDIHFLWEGTDPETNEGTSTYHRADKGEADLAWIAYIVGINPS